MEAHIVRSTQVVNSARVAQVLGIFDIPPALESSEQWDVSLPLDEHEWNVGLIVGPSGSGKSTIARELFGAASPNLMAAKTPCFSNGDTAVPTK